jgi:LysM repeat protein
VLKLAPPSTQNEKTYNKEVPKVVVLQAEPTQNPENKPLQHVVGKGESLVSIANRYKISAQLLAETNRLNLNDSLLEGQILQLPPD